MNKNKETAIEFLEAAYNELELGRIRSAALLVCAGFETLNLANNKLKTFKDLILSGFTPDTDKVEKLLKELEKELNIKPPITKIEINTLTLAVIGIILIITAFLDILPPWTNSLLIPAGACCFTPLLLKI
mgnify:CR=1 FL=1